MESAVLRKLTAHGREARPGSAEYRRALDEYREVGINFRHNADLRFRQLTLFAAITALLVTAYTSDRVPGAIKSALPMLGLVVTGAFAFLEERTTAYRLKYFRLALLLDDTLGFCQYDYTRLRWRWQSSLVFRVIFGAIGMLWLMAFVWTVSKVVTSLLRLAGLLQ